MRESQVSATRLFSWVSLLVAVGGGGLVIAGVFSPHVSPPQSVPSFSLFPNRPAGGFLAVAACVAASAALWAGRQTVVQCSDGQHAAAPSFAAACVSAAAWFVAYGLGSTPSLVAAALFAASFLALSTHVYIRQNAWLARGRRGLHLVADVAASWMVGFGILVLGTNLLQIASATDLVSDPPSPSLRAGMEFGPLFLAAGAACITRWDPAVAIFLFPSLLLLGETDFSLVGGLLAIVLSVYSLARRLCAPK